MTYNIRLGIQQGVDALGDIIAVESPDILALQEVGRHWQMGPAGNTAAKIGDRAGLDQVCYVTTIVRPARDRDAEYGHALLSRWPIEDRQVVGLTQQIDEPRAALTCRIQTPDGLMNVVSTHLSHRDDERASQGPELADIVDQLTADNPPTVLMGDLNESGHPAWLDTLETSMQDVGARSDQATYANPAPDRRIDYIMVHGATPTDARVVAEPDASDHRPVVATLKF